MIISNINKLTKYNSFHSINKFKLALEKLLHQFIFFMNDAKFLLIHLLTELQFLHFFILFDFVIRILLGTIHNNLTHFQPIF